MSEISISRLREMCDTDSFHKFVKQDKEVEFVKMVNNGAVRTV